MIRKRQRYHGGKPASHMSCENESNASLRWR